MIDSTSSEDTSSSDTSSEESAHGASAPTTGGEHRADRYRTGTRVLHTRASATWIAVVVAVLVLVLLVIFIAENTQRTTVSMLGLHGHAPTAVIILIAAIAGAAIVIVIGATRILQLRRAVKHPKEGKAPRRAGHRS
jgi:uncharacterized integral membrane protein